MCWVNQEAEISALLLVSTSINVLKATAGRQRKVQSEESFKGRGAKKQDPKHEFLVALTQVPRQQL